MSAPAADRTHLLDALRGFALFGVVWSNYAGLSLWMFLSPESRTALPGSLLDVPLETFHSILIDGKFYSIFSLLFGIGFGFFLAKGNDGLLRFYRRMFILLIIGWLHLRFIWAGDILFLYALLGLLLPLFRGLSDRALLIAAAALILSPIAIDAAVVITEARFDPAGPFIRWMEASDAQYGNSTVTAFLALPDGGWKELMHANERGWIFRFMSLIESNRAPKVLGLFLLGLWVSRRKLFADVEAHAPLLKRICIAGFAVGLPFSLLLWWTEGKVGYPPEASSLVRTASYALSVVPLAIAFASGFALLWRSDRWKSWLMLMAPMGRMALTNYLMQTIIALALFTGIGLGLGTRVSSITFDAMALGVFIVQVLWSHWWLKRFQFGPMEWLWRSLTYGKVMPMRK